MAFSYVRWWECRPLYKHKGEWPRGHPSARYYVCPTGGPK